MRKNSEVSTILIQRDKIVRENINAAMVYLDTEVYHIPGKLVMVRYYTDEAKTNIDTLFVVGVKEKNNSSAENDRGGFGRDYYSIISTAELFVVYDVLDEPVDVSELVQDQRFLCKVDGVWKIELISPDGTSRTFIDIPKDPFIFRNLANGLQYYYTNGELKREDSFVTLEMLSEELTILEGNVDPPKVSQFEVMRDETYLEGHDNVYPEGASLTNLQFRLSIKDYKNDDVTGQFMVKLYKNGEVVEGFRRINSNTYCIVGPIQETTTYEVKATKDDYILSEVFTISIVSPTYYGKMVNFLTSKIPILTKVWWDGNGEFNFVTNLNNEITVFAIPSNLKEVEFTSIKDTHGLNYIKDYHKVINTINATEYIVYYKKDQVIINNFKQTFGYE